MSTLLTDPAISTVLSLTAKATLLLGGAALVQHGLQRRTSAATRHMIWALAIAGVLVLPALSLVLPAWPVPIVAGLTNSSALRAPAEPVVPAETPAPQDVGQTTAAAPPSYEHQAAPPTPPGAPARIPRSAAVALVYVYAAGVIAVLLRLVLDRRSLRRLIREASDVRDADWTWLLADCAARLGVDRPVRLLRTRARSLPMAVGTRRQAIVIPATADTWSDDRRRAVLLHEMAHVGRYDCLTQMLAFAACALYWFHPAAWWVARRLRIERELACDDCAIAAGTQARDYAGHLLEIAYSCSGDRAPALAVSMARPRQLESRMLAALDAARNRRGPTARGRAACAAVAATALLALASATPTATATETTPALPATVTEDQSLMAIRDAAWKVVRDVAAAVQERLPGTWEIRPSKTEGTVHLRLVELNSSSGTNVPVARLEGLTAAHLTGAGGSVQFRIRRDAGTFTFEGVMRSGVGAGTFTFAPDAAFPAELAKRGFAQPTADEQYQMARHDIGFAFIDELTKQGYAKPATAELVRAGQHGVNDVYLREMAAVGYRLGTLAPLIELRDHGVTPTYVRELADLGYKGLTADGIRKARDHGITPDYVRAMRDEGYGSLPMERLIEVRDHGVDAAFARGFSAAGYSKLPIDELIRVRDHGVSAEYARGMRDLGHDLPIAELVRARDHGVDVQYAKAMAALGHASLRIDALIRLRDHGVTPDYVEGLKALGYDRLSADELVSLRDHGLTPERIKTANTRANSRLSVEALISAAARGIRD